MKVLLESCLIAVMIAFGIYLWRSLSHIQKLNQKRVSLTDRLKNLIKKQNQLKQNMVTLQKQFSDNVFTDPLTGLPSRKIFEDHLELTIHQSLRYQLTCSIMFLDLDGFKIINDALGYDVGDTILKEIAQRLKACVRQVDTICHFAGDEFVFIFSQIAKAETAAYIAQRLLDAVAEPLIIQEQELYITACVGIAVFPSDGTDGKVLLKNADAALRQAKLHGRNIYQFYRKEMHELSRRELILSSSLHHEINYQHFSVFYQPRVDLNRKKIVCMEAIVQWQNPDFGLVTFGELLRLAEKNNNLKVFYEWLLNKVCHDLMKWRENGFDPETISVQISLKQLESTQFIQKVATILKENKVDPSCLIFEIIESSLFTKIDLVEKMLHMLKRLGVKISINNFGATHLELYHLRRLPIDIFKVDRSLVYDVDSNRESEAIVKMIIGLSYSLQSQVIAEGVENANQRNALYSFGCAVMQGGLFSPPILATDFNEKVLQRIHESNNL